MTAIAIIGAGLSGLVLAQQLRAVAEVKVFEKSRGVGGRMATRHAGVVDFDHGAQFFTARSPEFQQFLQGADVAAAVAPWQAQLLTLEAGRKPCKREWFEPHYVAVPGMNALCKVLARDCKVNLHSAITALDRAGAGWQLRGAEQQDCGHFDWVISAIPAPQAAALLPAGFSGKARLNDAVFSPCFSLMLGLESAPPLSYDAAVVRQAGISWIAVNNSKPGRQPGTALVVHSDNQWAAARLQTEPDTVSAALRAALEAVTGQDFGVPVHQALQRWRYARVEASLGTDYLLDPAHSLAACGDWCRGNRVEDAYLSGYRLGQRLRSLL